jgi:DNA-binding HxlR family transcriptional regulator
MSKVHAMTSYPKSRTLPESCEAADHETDRVTIQFTPDDFMKMRFAYGPMLELVKSYCRLRGYKQGVLPQRWVEEVSQNLYGLEFPYIDALLTNAIYIPDFLTPTPLTNATTFEAELERIQETPVEVIRKNINTLIAYNAESEIVQQFLAYPYEALFCLLEEMRLYWSRALARHWPRMLAVAEGDVLYRARQLVLGGPEALFAGLYPKKLVEVNPLQLKIPRKAGFPSRYELTGQGFYLVPVIFGYALSWQIEPEWPAMLAYAPRGTGLWWEAPSPASDQSLEIALGEGRARVLRQLTTPANTGEIARQLDITAGAASQHLSRLNQAGLVEPRRTGRRVYYHLTRRGEQLLTLFS